ncbi:MAG: low molecular weight protein-tyrosine-phosphatase [Burkholderiaceae bacterium]
MHRILFVCLGNICRSPLAEGVLRRLSSRRGLSRHFVADSAGTHAQSHAGQRPDPRAIQVATLRGYNGLNKHKARALTEKDLEKFDRIVAMDSNNLAHLRKICPPQFQHKLHLLLEFAEPQISPDIPDPYYGSVEGFERVLDLCEAGVAGLIDFCMRQPSGQAAQTR